MFGGCFLSSRPIHIFVKICEYYCYQKYHHKQDRNLKPGAQTVVNPNQPTTMNLNEGESTPLAGTFSLPATESSFLTRENAGKAASYAKSQAEQMNNAVKNGEVSIRAMALLGGKWQKKIIRLPIRIGYTYLHIATIEYLGSTLHWSPKLSMTL